MPSDREVPEVLWTPDPSRASESAMARFRAHAKPDVSTYRDLWQWSVRELESFWSSLVDFFDVSFHDQPQAIIAEQVMPGAQWFPGATINYAEHALRHGDGKADHDPAVIFVREDGMREELTYGELRHQVAAVQAGLRDLGIRKGDRVVALVPNSPHALIAFLATAGLGAIWSSCSPDFGARAIADRFTQLNPEVLITVDGYWYNGKPFAIGDTISNLRQQLPDLRHTVLIPYLGEPADSNDVIAWSDLAKASVAGELTFEPVEFGHPLWVLYSSGTTGLPKGIVHSHGGIVLEHMKAVGLHCNLGPGDRFFWFTTTGWMMWNFLISGLLVGTTIVLYDGSPTYPDINTMWHLVEEHGITYFGTSAPFIHACHKAGLTPRLSHDLSDLHTVGSTGAPLSPDSFRWIAEAVDRRIQIASVSGGTDLCTAFVGASPDVPVWMGELSCRMLGAAVEAYDESGKPVINEVGELVITRPMPSMPVEFWNDEDGSRLRAAYFDDFPGVWRHGDWIKITDRGSAVIYGRSDATLNRGGVRMGTAEFYRVVEALPEVVDSLVIDTSTGTEADGQLLCFIVLSDTAALADMEQRLRSILRSQLSPRHVPDRIIEIDDVPRTLNGKKCEVPVKKILAGTPASEVISLDALRNPESLSVFTALARQISR